VGELDIKANQPGRTWHSERGNSLAHAAGDGLVASQSFLPQDLRVPIEAGDAIVKAISKL
jgi:hypothetical protein